MTNIKKTPIAARYNKEWHCAMCGYIMANKPKVCPNCGTKS